MHLSIMPHLPYPGQTWGINRLPFNSTGLGSPGVSLLLDELKRELQYEILVACIAWNSTNIRLVVRPEVRGK